MGLLGWMVYIKVSHGVGNTLLSRLHDCLHHFADIIFIPVFIVVFNTPLYLFNLLVIIFIILNRGTLFVYLKRFATSSTLKKLKWLTI